MHLYKQTERMKHMIKRRLSYLISETDTGRTIEEFLRKKGYSHRLIVHLRNTPLGLTINGETAYTTHILKEKELLCVTLKEEESSGHIIPAPLALSIVYEDEDILVVNKAPGVPIHPSQGHFEHTLANAVAWYYQSKGETIIYRAINRLDRDTSGLLIIAKHMLSACILSDQMVKRQIRREYRALVCGNVPPKGTITVPVGRVSGSTIMRQADLEHGESACTHFTKLSYDSEKDLSYISLKLDTGRTHQIRVHMAYIGHPLPGDFLYHPDYRFINRQPLHSFRLDFTHPLTKEPMTFYAPLPDDMAALVSEDPQQPTSA